jgi:deoxyribodipyrimidine photo-lyase
MGTAGVACRRTGVRRLLSAADPTAEDCVTNAVRAPAVVWFRQDLRLSDNPALAAAAERGQPILPVYIWAPEEEGAWPPGAASRWWLSQSLASLNRQLQARGSRLIVSKGPTAAALQRLIADTGASAVYWNRRYEPAAIARDDEVKAMLRARGVAAESFNGSLLFEPWTLQNQSGKPFRVFTPFWRACLARPVAAPFHDAPPRMTAPAQWPASLEISELGLEPRVDWAPGLRETWRPGEAGAQTHLKRLLTEVVRDYPKMRDVPLVAGTSRLSPHLHFGEVSPGQIWRTVLQSPPQPMEGCEAYLRQLCWREFAYHLLYHNPDIPHQALRPEFANFPWQNEPELFQAWAKGHTGYPLVDAGMRELWHTGWMHNRVRMVAASFLVKHLLINWQQGAAFFWDTLVDADLANNTLAWQWVAGCGADAAPYFRIFNPTAQAAKFDPDGAYVRRWAPEPRPKIIDHEQARRRALEAFKGLKNGSTGATKGGVGR